MSLFERRRSQKSMRDLYNWFCRHYGIIERVLGPELEEIAQAVISGLPDVSGKSAVEYACGTGMLTSRLARYFSKVDARDLSAGMLAIARERLADCDTVSFSEGDMLAISEPADSYDWAFVSFALHLFNTDQQSSIIENLFAVSRNGVIIIDHRRRWNPLSAFVEWLEGSYYDEFIKTDFRRMADRIGASHFEEITMRRSSVMIFRKKI